MVAAFTSVRFFSALTSCSSGLVGAVEPPAVGLPPASSPGVDAGVAITGSFATVLFSCFSSVSGAVLFFFFFSAWPSSCSPSPSSSVSSSSPSSVDCFPPLFVSESWAGAACSVLVFAVTEEEVGFCVL